MRKLWIVLATVFIGNSASSQEQSDMTDVEIFFSLIQSGEASAVEDALIKNPALATDIDKYGFQPIHVLDYIDFEEKLALLTRYGADINARNDEGIGLLHILIDTDFLPLVLLAGADLELKDELGRTPVMVYLTDSGGLSMVAALLGAGADPNASDSSGQSVLGYARLWNDPQVTQIVIEAGGVNSN